MSSEATAPEPAVFISWSGPVGEVLAAVLKEFMTSLFLNNGRKVDIEYSPTSIRAGSDWRRELQRSLERCEVGIVIVEPAALMSPWVAYEVGVLTAQPSNSRHGSGVLIPIVPDGAAKIIDTTPFEVYQCSTFASDDIVGALSHVCSFFGMHEVSHAITRATVAPLVSALRESWRHAVVEERRNGAALRADLLSVIRRYEMFGLLAEDDARALSYLAMLSRSDIGAGSTLLREIGELSDHFSQALRVEREFGDRSVDWLLANLVAELKEQLREVGRGRLPIRNRAPVRDFWRRQVFGRAEKTVWTTNVATPGENMGGSGEPFLLAAQRDAIERGVRVVRLFVYDVGISPAEVRNRRDLMREQLKIGIEVHVITSQFFKTKSDMENARRRVGADDFMIVDGQFLYLTEPHAADDIEACFIDGEQHSKQLADAEAFREVLMAAADEITLENIDRFSDELGPS